MHLYVARHGQTQWNVENKVCGRTDLPLPEEGIAQAKALAKRAAEMKLDLIIVSPMLRAKQTAGEVANRLGIPMIVDDRLIEQDYGIFEGVHRKDPGFLENKSHFAFRYPGGESMMDVACRVYGFLADVKWEHRDKNVLLVCHGGVCRVLNTYFENMTNSEFFHYSPDNASVKAYEL